MLAGLFRREQIEKGEFDLSSLPSLLNKDNPIILDIGCNDGTHTLKFLELFPHAHVHSFEPDPRAQSRFKEKVNGKAKLYPLAISDTDGTAIFHMSGGRAPDELSGPDDWDLSGSLRTPKKHLEFYKWCSFDKSIEVQTKRLDTWRAERGINLIDFIWADVQGAEENLIKGARETLRQTRYFYTECIDVELYEGQLKFKELLKLLPDFEIVKRYAGDALLRNRLLQNI